MNRSVDIFFEDVMNKILGLFEDLWLHIVHGMTNIILQFVVLTMKLGCSLKIQCTCTDHRSDNNIQVQCLYQHDELKNIFA